MMRTIYDENNTKVKKTWSQHPYQTEADWFTTNSRVCYRASITKT